MNQPTADQPRPAARPQRHPAHSGQRDEPAGNAQPAAAESVGARGFDEVDEVDELVAAWLRERPDLDPQPMQIWSRISRLAQLVSQARAEAFAQQELQPWEFDVLAALRRSGRPYRLSPGRLLRLTHVTSGTMTNRIDRLSERGLVRRGTDPNDGRGVLVELTEQGRGAVDAALGALLDAESALLSGIGEAQREGLSLGLRELLLAQEDAQLGEL